MTSQEPLLCKVYSSLFLPTTFPNSNFPSNSNPLSELYETIYRSIMTAPSNLPPRGMVYNEVGDLVEAEELTKPSDGLEITPMMRMINFTWHYNVSPYSVSTRFGTLCTARACMARRSSISSLVFISDRASATSSAHLLLFIAVDLLGRFILQTSISQYNGSGMLTFNYTVQEPAWRYHCR